MVDFTISGEEFHPDGGVSSSGARGRWERGRRGLIGKGLKARGITRGKVIAGHFHFQEGEREIRGEEGADMRDLLGGEREREKGSWAGLAGLGPGCGPVGLGHHPFLFFFSFFSNFCFGF
jgi:hypothetical protein